MDEREAAQRKPGEITVVQPAEEEEGAPADVIEEPGKLLRIASMIRELLEEVRQATLDEGGRRRLQEIYGRSVGELKEALSPDLQRELEELALPLSGDATESEVRLAQAQLLGWMEGLFHGIQAALWSQQMQARAALEEMRRRSLPPGHPAHQQQPGRDPREERPPTPGQYL